MTELSGVVAILSEDLASVEEYRDLGPDPVAVKVGKCLPVIDEQPSLLENQYYGEPIVVIEEEAVRRIYPVLDRAVDIGELNEERDRRLGLGFDYDFGDSRGVHRINTTPGDMIGWDEVTKFAQALINSGQGGFLISIATGTGIVQLTANEWQAILIGAALFRQPIWGASFMIEQLNPIPHDFRDDAYWTQ